MNLLELTLELPLFLPLWRSNGSAFLRSELRRTAPKIISVCSEVGGDANFDILLIIKIYTT